MDGSFRINSMTRPFFLIATLIIILLSPNVSSSNSEFENAPFIQQGIIYEGLLQEAEEIMFRINVSVGDTVEFQLIDFDGQYIEFCVYGGNQSTESVRCVGYHTQPESTTFFAKAEHSVYFITIYCSECSVQNDGARYSVMAIIHEDEDGDTITKAAVLKPEHIVNGTIHGEESDFYSTPVINGDSIEIVITDESGTMTSYRLYDHNNVKIDEKLENPDYRINLAIEDDGNLTIELFCAFNGICEYSVMVSSSTYVDESNPDLNQAEDKDGIRDVDDICPNTPLRENVDDLGCADLQKDSDNDGVNNRDDFCPDSPSDIVNGRGCSAEQADADNDGVIDSMDLCDRTKADEEADEFGCGLSQKNDNDHDGIPDSVDMCPSTDYGQITDDSGCAPYQIDEDYDGILNVHDLCPGSDSDILVDIDGCTYQQNDQDSDGVLDVSDQCPNSLKGTNIKYNGCKYGELPILEDDDDDGIIDAWDFCPNTIIGEKTDLTGCSLSQLDDDGDGISNAYDECPEFSNKYRLLPNGCEKSSQILGIDNNNFHTFLLFFCITGYFGYHFARKGISTIKNRITKFFEDDLEIVTEQNTSSSDIDTSFLDHLL